MILVKKQQKRLIAVNQRFRPILIVAFNMTSKLIKEKQLKKYSKFESSTVAVSQFSSISNSDLRIPL
jgi:hypothetical protein